MLANDSLVATDNDFWTTVLWFNTDPNDGVNNMGASMYQVDPVDTYTSGASIRFLDEHVPDHTNQFIYNASILNSDSSKTFGFDAPDDVRDAGTWYCWIISFDTARLAGKSYLNDVESVGAVFSDFSGGTFTPTTNGLPFLFGSDTYTGDFWKGSFADVRIMPGVSLLNESGDIPEATRRLFIDADGKPVDPTVATAALGAPCLLFSGDASSFATNQGTGGAFTLTGTLTNATTSPSD